MKIIAMIDMMPLIARKVWFWSAICGRLRMPAIIASVPMIRVVVAVKFFSPSLWRIEWKRWIGEDSIMKPMPRIVSQSVSV